MRILILRKRRCVMDSGHTQSSRESDINLYLLELKSVQEDTDPLLYWLMREKQYPNISKLALDLVSAPASQAYVNKSIFYVWRSFSKKAQQGQCWTGAPRFLKTKQTKTRQTFPRALDVIDSPTLKNITINQHLCFILQMQYMVYNMLV